MQRLLGILIVLVPAFVLVHVAKAQTAFDVVSIHLSSKSLQFERDGETDVAQGALRMRDVTVSTCIKFAYGIRQGQIIAPAGFDDVHYDIVAKTSPETTIEAMRPMMQELLRERFKLSVHHDRKELNGFSLTVDPRGVKMKLSADQDGVLYRQNSAIGTVARNMTLGQFVNFIADPLRAPVSDDTHLQGKYDFRIDFTGYVDQPKEIMASVAAVLTAAMHDQLGLDLKRRKSEFDVMVIDHVEAPTPN